jgi:hypothetical protein
MKTLLESKCVSYANKTFLQIPVEITIMPHPACSSWLLGVLSRFILPSLRCTYRCSEPKVAVSMAACLLVSL